MSKTQDDPFAEVRKGWAAFRRLSWKVQAGAWAALAIVLLVAVAVSPDPEKDPAPAPAAAASPQPASNSSAADARAIARHLKTVHMSNFFGVLRVAHSGDSIEILTNRVKGTAKGDSVVDALCGEINDWKPELIEPGRIVLSGWKPAGDDPGRTVLGYCRPA